MPPWDLDKPDDDLVEPDAPGVIIDRPPNAHGTHPELVLQPRDIELFAYVARHGVCTPEQLHRRFWTGRDVSIVHRRLRKLTRHGYLVCDHTWYHGPLAIRVTRAALRAAELPFHPIRLNWGRLRHQLSMVELSEELLARDPGSTWRTERELRREWFADRARGVEHARLPDGMLAGAGERVAVELELSEKRAPDYRGLGDAYLQELILGITAVWWFVASDRIAEQLHTHFAPMYGDNPWRIEAWAASSN